MKVRIPGIISSSGKYCIHGYEGSDDEPDWAFLEETAEAGGDPESTYRRVWITVDLPIPDTAEVQGECLPDPSS